MILGGSFRALFEFFNFLAWASAFTCWYALHVVCFRLDCDCLLIRFLLIVSSSCAIANLNVSSVVMVGRLHNPGCPTSFALSIFVRTKLAKVSSSFNTIKSKMWIRNCYLLVMPFFHHSSRVKIFLKMILRLKYIDQKKNFKTDL